MDWAFSLCHIFLNLYNHNERLLSKGKPMGQDIDSQIGNETSEYQNQYLTQISHMVFSSYFMTRRKLP